MSRRHAELEVLFWTIRLTILLILPLHVTDVGIYMGDMAKVLEAGQWPYRDFPFEYPPLTFLILFLPSLALKLAGFGGEWSYRLLMALFILPFDYAIFRSFLKRPPVASSAFLYVALSTVLWQLIYDRLDLLVGFAIVYPFLRFTEKKESDAGFTLGWGIGAALKLVPLLLFPFRFLEKRGPLLAQARLALLTVLPLALSTLLVLGISGGHISFLSHHSQRGVQVESLLGNLFLSLQSCGLLAGAAVETSFRSQQVTGFPGLITAAKFLFWVMLATTYSTLAFAVARRGFSSLRATWLFLLTFITFGYVLSPQFFFWIIPLGIVAARELSGKERGRFLFHFFAVLFMTALHFNDYWNYAGLHRENLLFLTARNGALVLFWIRCWIWFRARPAAAIS